MAAIQITNGVTSIGVLNPNMRVFDIVMATEYGTSYNAYLVEGEKSSALIETVHLDFFESYIDTIKSVTELTKIEYLIMNHNEPDHSGAVAKLLELLPNLKIVISQAGSIYLKNIANRTDMNIIVAKDGDEIDLGGKTLKFINAPFLHWPDSMFTYLKEEKVLFSCDFLGAHFCEPMMIDQKMLPKYKAAYFSAVLNYYTAIFGPFKPYVLKGLEKIEGLDIDFAATSHGPVLTKKGLLPEVKRLYSEWSQPVIREKKLIPIFYCSAYGNTEKLAHAIANGVRKGLSDADVAAFDLIENEVGDMAAMLNGCDGFLIGSPTINKDAVPPIWNLLSHIDAINFAKRPAAIFGSYGWSGEAFKNIRARLESLKANVAETDCKIVFAPTEEDLKNAEQFGEDFAKMLA